ncbi:MAG: hypothetical protein JW936_00070 [Sedimentisphaerales bacterium]|nr:hypothetical protein [Sedimentisphaerales bacterium]
MTSALQLYRKYNLVCWPAVLLLAAGLLSYARADEGDGELSPVQVMLQVVLSDSTDMPLRLNNARILFKDPSAHQVLADMLNSPGSIQAKKILCRVIATSGADFPTAASQTATPEIFIDPLFNLLGSTDPELSYWAGQALTRFRDGVVARLGEIAASPEAMENQRSASISALEIMPGKEAVLAIGEVLDTENTAIAELASQVLAGRLGLAQPITAEQYRSDYFPVLRVMSAEAFLRWQVGIERRMLQQLERDSDRNAEQIDYWRRRALESLGQRFDQLQGQARVSFLAEQLAREQSDEVVRLWALEKVRVWCESGSVGNNGTATALLDFLRPLIADPSDAARQMTARIIARLGEQGRVLAEPLAAQLRVEAVPDVLAAQLETLGNLQYAPAASDFLHCLASNESEVVIQAARALGRVIESSSAPLSAEVMQNAITTLRDVYRNGPSDALVRGELIRVMQKISGQEAYRDTALREFDPILIEALSNTDGGVRRSAVSALTTLHNADVLAILEQQRNPLDDMDTRVRFVVIDAFSRYGHMNELGLLRSSLVRETDNVLTDDIVGACRAILQRNPMGESYSLVVDLANAEGNLALLYREALLILTDKITEQRNSGGVVSADIEEEAYRQMAALSEADGEVGQAVTWYVRLLSLDISPEQRAVYQLKVVDFALSNVDSDAILSSVGQVVPAWIAQPDGADVLDRLEQYYQALSLDEAVQTRQAARIVTSLISPSQVFPTEQLAAEWRQRRLNIAVALIEQQQSSLAQENGVLDPQAVRLAMQLDGRLTGFPFEGTLAEKQGSLAQFHEILVPTPVTVPPVVLPDDETEQETPAEETPTTNEQSAEADSAENAN